MRDLEKSSGWGFWLDTAVFYWTTTGIVLFGVYLGHFYLLQSSRSNHFRTPHRWDLASAFGNWDGQWYLRVARDGYFYDPEHPSTVNFFPMFPLTGRCLAWATGVPHDLSLTLVANICFFLAMALLGDYIRRRPDLPSGFALYAPLAMALFPVGFFFRMAYSESLFLLLAILTFHGLERRWSIVLVAGLVGLATAARPVGVALIPPLLLAAWRRYTSLGKRSAVLTLAVPLCVWGLAAYMIFQYVRFGEPLAFIKSHAHWRYRAKLNLEDQVLAIATLEPLWSVYDESSPAYWRRHETELGPAFSLVFANPIYFAGVAALVGYGAWRNWLSAAELLFASGVLLIPYLLKGYECCMIGHARYATVAFPVYLVLGRLLAAIPPAYAAAILSLSGFFLGIYAALFASWFPLL